MTNETYQEPIEWLETLSDDDSNTLATLAVPMVEVIAGLERNDAVKVYRMVQMLLAEGYFQKMLADGQVPPWEMSSVSETIQDSVLEQFKHLELNVNEESGREVVAFFSAALIGLGELDWGEESMDHEAPVFDLSGIPTDDGLALYLREMAQQDLLSADEEIQLAKEMEAGREAQQKIDEQQDTLTSAEMAELGEIIELGNEARAHLIRANTRLVVSVAKRYRGRGLPFMDLIQEGNIGLIKAAEKYDHRRGNRFSTYATWWIRQAVTRSLSNHSRTIRIPAHLVGVLSKFFRDVSLLTQQNEKELTAEEIAEGLDMPVRKVRELLRHSMQPTSLDRSVKGDPDTDQSYFVKDENAVPPAKEMAKSMLAEEVEALLGQLTPREARILRLRYGLQDGESRTLKEVGEMFGLSRERIRQLEKEALRKLKHPDFAGHLRDYLSD